ncbi:unnamed protein product [Bursaphelenchus xylophilus]|uniref:(pine wood nematode) hypothetical protein n=1 Tax=Bursaphelenchus xylophilus TaxID=6326 RepID=A0A7I8WL55_BURXY|nr:unnamed protein product [Bursaphelenchus xylophilus]CAG9105919.1 unnamed protein product [Bursaphelenchus xylophilus]
MEKEKLVHKNDQLNELLAMGWLDHLAPVVTSGILMVACWSIGHYGFSIIWIGILTLLYFIKTRMWVTRQEARLNMRKQILRERGLIGVGNKSDELPSWIRFPDTERIEWVNQVLKQLWPFISQYSAQFMREFIEPQVLEQMPSPFKSFKFLDIDMGDMPFRVSGLKVYTHNVGRDRIIVDLDVAYAGDAEFKVKTCGFTGGMNELVLSGKVRCVLCPLLPQPPMIGGFSASFVELPKFDFNLTGMGDFLQLPLLMDAIRSIINAQMANLCVLPNSIVIPLVPNVDVNKLNVPIPDGVLRIKIVEARNLENKDVSFLTKDKSDPYCEVQLGSQLFKTETINNDLNPVFNEYFEAIVDQASVQKLRLNMFDEDTTRQDEELGRLSIPLSYVRKQKLVSKWFHLEACKHGELYVKLFWCDLSSENKGSIPNDSEWLSTNKTVHTLLLMAFVDNVRELPYPKANLEPSPVLDFTIGNTTQRTPVKVKTVNPIYQFKCYFFVQNAEYKELTVKAIDSTTTKPLGELSISLGYLMEQPEMEVFDKVFQLRHGVSVSHITLTLRARHIVPSHGDSASLSGTSDDISQYANASHIERAYDLKQENNNIHVNSNGVHKDQKDDVMAPEPGKIPEVNEKLHPESKNQLNTGRYQTLDRKASFGSQSSYQKGDNKLNRLLKPKFRKGQRDSSKPVGRLQVNLKYDEPGHKLLVDVITLDELVPLASDGSVSPYVQVKLIPHRSNHARAKKRTNTVVNSGPKLAFNTELDFEIDSNDIAQYKMKFSVKDSLNYGVLSRTPTLGESELPLTNFHPSKPILGHWLNLEAPRE